MTDAASSIPRNTRVRPSGTRQVIDWVVARRLHVVLAAVIVVAVSLQQNFSDLAKTPFHPDESRWLNRADYVSALRDPLSSAWEDRYLTRGQPPGGSYVTGLGLLIQGRDLKTNGAWDFHFGSERVTWWNASRGNMPSRDDVMAARRTSAIIGTITALALFLIVSRISSTIGGLAAGLFLAVHPLSVYLSTLAVSDAAFTCMVALATLAGLALAAKPTWPRTALLGLILGAGAATKLTPLFLALGLAAIGVVLVAEPWLRRVPPARWLIERTPGFGTPSSARLGWMLLCVPVITVMTFVASYPFLWPDPIGRTRSLFAFRRDEMNNQARIWEQFSVDSRLEALSRAWTMLENRYSASGKAVAKAAELFGGSTSERGIDLPFALAGLAILLVLAFRRGVTSPTFLALAIAGGQSLIILGGMRVDFDRYYLPLVFLCAMGIGVLSATVWSFALRHVPLLSAWKAPANRPVVRLNPPPTSAGQTAD